jgi:ribosomal protein S18 acetylase RimI-like enzyme
MKIITKNFSNKEIIIRSLVRSDLLIARKFQNFINSLVEEQVMISSNRKMTLKQEINFLEKQLKKIKSKEAIFITAEDKNKKIIVGNANIGLKEGGKNHVGVLGISVAKNYRHIGLGNFLMKEIIKIAKKELRPRPKIIRLSVYHVNKPAMKLYKRIGFKRAARIPKQFEYNGKLLDEVVMILEL